MGDEDIPLENIQEFRMLDPVSKNAMYLGHLLELAIVLAFAVPLTVFVPEAADYLVYMWVCVAAIAVYLLASPVIFYNHYRYRMDDDCIEVRRGVIFHSHVLVPVERVHQVEVSKGPILRKYNLAKVTVTTAGGTAAMEYLNDPVAEYIAANLNEKIIKLLKARE